MNLLQILWGGFFYSFAGCIDGGNPFAGVAQLVEHVLGKDGVTGPIPVSSLSECLSYVARALT